MAEDDQQILTTTNMEDPSGYPPNQQRSRRWPGREDVEQGIDDIFLPHEDGDKKIGHNGIGNLSSVGLMCRSKANENRHVCREGYAKKSPVGREEHIAQVTNGLGMPLFDIFFVQVTFPVESTLVGSVNIERNG